MNNKIEIDDAVAVYFENVEAEPWLRVLYIPMATGDSWQFKRLSKRGGDIVYIQNFSKMVRLGLASNFTQDGVKIG